MKVIKCIISLLFMSILLPCAATAGPLDNWSTVTTNTDDWFYKITYGNNTFVIAGAYGKILTSPDGLSWTSRSLGNTNHLYGVGFGNHTFVAVGTVGTIFTASDTDLDSWTLRRSGQAHPVSQNLFGVAYGVIGTNQTFVAVGGHGTILTSTDNGVTWYQETSGTVNWLYDILYNDNLFVDVGAYGTTLHSTNGFGWQPGNFLNDKHLLGIAYGNDTFVAVGEQGIILTSPDGMVWTITRDPSSSQEDLNGITYGLVDGSGCFVAVGESGAILTSPDGITWTYRNSGTMYTLEDAAYGYPVFVIVGGYGTILRTFSGLIAINEGAAYTNSTSATLTLSCNGFSSSGCAQMQFSDDNVTWSSPEAYNTSRAWALTSGDGLKTVYAKFQDNSGNWSDPYPDSVILDTAAPATSAAPGGGTYDSSQSVTLTCSDGSGSGCQGIYYTTDGSTPTTSSTVYSNPISIASNTTLNFFAKDNAGNSSSVDTETYVFEFNPPLAITTTSLVSGTLGIPYSVTLAATGGIPPYSWSIVSGSLPDGLSLNSVTGELSGTPTISGIFNFTAQVTDTYPSAVSQPLSIVIVEGASPGVRNGNAPFLQPFGTIQDVYDAAGDGDTIQAQEGIFIETVNFNRNIMVTLMGGFNADYTTNTSYTIVNGTVTVSYGTVVMNNIIIQ